MSKKGRIQPARKIKKKEFLLAEELERPISPVSSDSSLDAYWPPKRGRHRYLPKKFVKNESNPVCIERIFDRRVDLSKYDEDTPMYPICREWHNNFPTSTNIKDYRNQKPTINTIKQKQRLETSEYLKLQNLSGVVNTLPMPKKVNLKPIPVFEKPKVQEFKCEFKDVSTADLLAQHKQNWKKTSQKWKKHVTDYNNKKYGDSYKVLDDLFQDDIMWID